MCISLMLRLEGCQIWLGIVYTDRLLNNFDTVKIDYKMGQWQVDWTWLYLKDNKVYYEFYNWILLSILSFDVLWLFLHFLLSLVGKGSNRMTEERNNGKMTIRKSPFWKSSCFQTIAFYEDGKRSNSKK